MHTKFGDSHFSRSGDMIAGIEMENVENRVVWVVVGHSKSQDH